ncbi:MAG: AraC family transcriptional regulator [Gammaproteobacteria bacterium]|nr:AraC family transcriptional regulator [Gammaproteobacteria bacterium]
MNDDSAPGKPATISERGAGMPGTELRASSQDDYPENETAFSCSNMEFDDFDAQSEQLNGHRHEYLKLSTGPFRGRLVSASLGGGIAVHQETVNCAMYQRVGCPEGLIELGVSLGRAPVAVNGIELGRNDVVVARPGSQLELDVPPEGAEFLVLAVTPPLLQSLECMDSSLELLDPHGRKASVAHGTCLAKAIETGGKTILETCALAPATWRPHDAARALVAEAVAALELDTSLGIVRERTRTKRSAAVFAAARDALSVMRKFDYATLSAATGRSPRSIQLAFAECIQTTPLRYFRAIRLHRARNALLAGAGERSATIGDIAAAHGFSNWSLFTQLYRRQFGEAPSETRARAAGRDARRALHGWGSCRSGATPAVRAPPPHPPREGRGQRKASKTRGSQKETP